MTAPRDLAGAWTGELLDLYGAPCWHISLTLSPRECGAYEGDGRMRSAFDPDAPEVVVNAELRSSANAEHLILRAPQRFDGVCWTHTLRPHGDELHGEGSYFESPDPPAGWFRDEDDDENEGAGEFEDEDEDPFEGEPGSITLRRAES